MYKTHFKLTHFVSMKRLNRCIVRIQVFDFVKLQIQNITSNPAFFTWGSINSKAK